MSNCRFCGTEIQAYTGRRPKEYCSASCRQKAWQKARKIERETAKSHTSDTIPFPNDFYLIQDVRIHAPGSPEHGKKVTEAITKPQSATFMGIPIPNHLKGIELRIWKEEIKQQKKSPT